METEETAVFAQESGSPAHNPDPVPFDPENTGSAAPGSSGAKVHFLICPSATASSSRYSSGLGG